MKNDDINPFFSDNRFCETKESNHGVCDFPVRRFRTLAKQKQNIKKNRIFHISCSFILNVLYVSIVKKISLNLNRRLLRTKSHMCAVNVPMLLPFGLALIATDIVHPIMTSARFGMVRTNIHSRVGGTRNFTQMFGVLQLIYLFV